MSAERAPKRVLKLQVTVDEHDLIRLAAAMRRQSLADFVRDHVLREAERLTEGIEFPPASDEE